MSPYTQLTRCRKVYRFLQTLTAQNQHLSEALFDLANVYLHKVFLEILSVFII